MKNRLLHHVTRDLPHACVRLLLPLMLIAAFSGQPGTVHAQSQGVVGTPVQWQGLSNTERQELLGRLTDDQVRDLVWQMMEADSAPEVAADAGFVGEITAVGERIRAMAASWVAQVPELPGVLSAVGASLSPPGMGVMGTVLVLVFIIIVIGGGIAAERIVHRVASPWWDRVTGASTGFASRLGYALLRLVLRTLEVAAFAAVAATLFLLLWQGHEPTRILVGYLIVAVAVTQFGARVSEVLWSPRIAAQRLVPVADESAARIHRYVVWIVALGAAQFCLMRYLRALDIEIAMLQLLAYSLATAYVVLINVWMWRIQKPLAGIMVGEQRTGGPLVSLFASSWPLIYGVLTVGILVLAIVAEATSGAQQSGAGYSTLLIVIALPFLLGAVKPLIDDLFERHQGQAVTMGESVAPRTGLRRPLARAIRIVLVIGALAWVSSLWGFDLIAFVNSRFGSVVGHSVLQIAVAILVAWAIWSVAKRAIDPHMVEHEGGGAEEAGEIGGTGVSRIATLLPLIRKSIFVVLVVMTAMISLSALGVNIGPLLAGAGVIGIAVGFGAQSLITDIISGLFFLMDDAFRRGEYVEIGGTRGSVEKISIRSFQLRHHNGPLHTVPYGQIGSITNYSRDWAIMKFEIRVPFEVDVDRVRKLIKKVGQEMMKDPEVAEMLLEPLKSQGVNRMDDSAFILRCKFTAKPGKQFMARRLAYSMIQEAFQREGIHFAPRRVIVETVSRDAAAAAGAAAIDDKPAEGGGDDRG